MFLFVLVIVVVLWSLNKISYNFLKPSIAARGQWDLNICCGKTSYGKVNADICKHSEKLNNFVLIKDIYHLPFEDNEFNNILCSHTLEHISDPKAFDKELHRVGKNVVYIVPPIWDLAAQLNFYEHKWITFAIKKRQVKFPVMIPSPLSLIYHFFFKQKIKA